MFGRVTRFLSIVRVALTFRDLRRRHSGCPLANYENFVHCYGLGTPSLKKCRRPPVSSQNTLIYTGGAERMLPLSVWRLWALFLQQFLFTKYLVLCDAESRNLIEAGMPRVRW
jgi:hypothetical protein